MDTRLKLAFAIKELMKTNSMDKITVGDIAEKAGVTRQTFYRNFQDKFALVNWYFEILVQDSFLKLGKQYTLFHALEQKFIFIKSEIVFFKVAFKTQAYDSLFEYDYRYILKFYRDIIKKKINQIPPDVDFALELYCKGSIGKTVEWVMDPNRCEPKEIASMLASALPENLKNLLMDF